MCVGIPMQVIKAENDKGIAWCRSWLTPQTEHDTTQQPEMVDTRLVGEADEGSWLLVFLGAAREIISAERARQTGQALQALQQIGSGDTSGLDALFADLDREPQLPPHLRAAATGE
ncbi:MAG: HypC/HybG/HupF family hydrogenase formation chaperone [Oleibacter sp.]|nr:HypC/HybG/HupF family hydrogenase formation chaperone [Thalassolituus sp.]|tara:strand:+ start:1973 stop:2320 length:348 start_codon:yes stop_codon:yes gene_type:complete